MSECCNNWKLPKEFPAEVRKIRTKDGVKYGLRVGPRRVLMTQYEAECVLTDLMVILKEVQEYDDRR